jgi:hypothetical protein
MNANTNTHYRRTRMNPRTKYEIAEEAGDLPSENDLSELDEEYAGDDWEDQFGNQNETLDGMD